MMARMVHPVLPSSFAAIRKKISNVAQISLVRTKSHENVKEQIPSNTKALRKIEISRNT